MGTKLAGGTHVFLIHKGFPDGALCVAVFSVEGVPEEVQSSTDSIFAVGYCGI